MNNQHTKKEPTIESQKEKDLRHTKKQSPTYHEKIKHQKKRETKLMKYHTKTEQIDMKIKTQLTFFDLNEGTKCPQRDKRQAQNPKGEKQTREEANQKGKNKPERREPQPKRLRPRRSQSENKTRPTNRPTIGNHDP